VDVVKFAIDAGKADSNGLTVCLRANFNLLNTKCLLRADENLSIVLGPIL
jgi:hypothetical protein